MTLDQVVKVRVLVPQLRESPGNWAFFIVLVRARHDRQRGSRRVRLREARLAGRHHPARLDEPLSLVKRIAAGADWRQSRSR